MKDYATPSVSSDRDCLDASDIATPSEQHFDWIRPSAFWLPAWEFTSAQAEHVPFFFWLVDATRPRQIVDLVTGGADAYLAFCQAVDRLDCGTRCTGLADIFSRRDSERDPAAPLAYHNLHFGQFSNLANHVGEIIEWSGANTVDLLHIDGRQVSQISESEARACLDLLSPKALILIERSQHLPRSWLELLEGKASCALNGSGLRLTAVTAEHDRSLSALLRDNGTSATARSMRMVFARLGAALREQAMAKDTASFATRLEIALADRSAAVDLLNEANSALEGELARLTPERDQLLVRIEVLEPHIEQFRTEVTNLEQRALQAKMEVAQLQNSVSERELELRRESARLQQILNERELQSGQETRRLQTLISERDLQADLLQSIVNERNLQTDRLQKMLNERDLDLKRRSEELLSANEYATLQNERLEQSVQSQDELRRQVSRLEHDLNAIIRSTAWRITAPIRMLGQKFPRAARLFRRGLKLLWWTVSLELFARLREWHRRRQPAHVAAVANPSPAASPPATAPETSMEAANPLRRILTGTDYSSTRVQYIENRMVELSSILDLERRRVDYALLGVDGLLNEIELYHDARRRDEYRQAFEEPTPLVSICVATMNRSDLLIERCLKSLLSQSYRNIQIVVCGDHCTDDTGSRIARLRDDRISFHNLPVRGPYPLPGIDRWRVAGTNAINAALSMCEGQFIAHLDDDDSATVDRIETMLNAAQTHKADFCWHSFWNERKDGGWHKLGDGRLELGQVTTGSIFYHSYFKKIPWDVHAYRTQEPGDWNRLRKIRALRPNFHFVDRPLLFHYTEGNQPPFVRFDGETFLE